MQGMIEAARRLGKNRFLKAQPTVPVSEAEWLKKRQKVDVA
jgi:hypothetical protein